MTNKSLEAKQLTNSGTTDPGFTGYGLCAEDQSNTTVSFNWILASSVIPQPRLVRGIWKNNGVWFGSSVWYS